MRAGEADRSHCSLTIIPDLDGYELSVSVEKFGNRIRAKSAGTQRVDEVVYKIYERIDVLIHAINPDREYESHQMAPICEELRITGRQLAETLFSEHLLTFEQLLASCNIEQVDLMPIGKVKDLPIEFCVLHIAGQEFFLGELTTVRRIFVATDVAPLT